MLMQFVNKGSTECRTRLPRFWYFFKKVQKERLEENTSEQLRLRTAVEFDGERKRVFCPQLLQVSHELRPCCVRPIAAGIDNLAHSRCKTLKQAWFLTRLLATLWESSGLKALLWGAKAPVVASIATVSQCHRHFYENEL